MFKLNRAIYLAAVLALCACKSDDTKTTDAKQPGTDAVQDGPIATGDGARDAPGEAARDAAGDTVPPQCSGATPTTTTAGPSPLR